MGCALGKEQPSTREAKFILKASDLCDSFYELKNDIIKTRNLLYQKFNIKSRIKSGSGDSKNSIETQTCAAPQRFPTKDIQKKTTLVNLPLIEDQATRDQIPTLQLMPNYTLMVNIDEFIFIDTALEWKYLKETYLIYIGSHKNTQKICDMCRFFLSRMEEQIIQLEEIYKQSDILNKCVRAFKSEIKNKQRTSLFTDLVSIVQNSKNMIDQLKSTKSNVSQLSLMTLVADTSDSLVNCNSTPVY